MPKVGAMERIASDRKTKDEAQRQVADFVAFLKRQHELVNHPTARNGADPSRQPFIGMWRNREDMIDSVAWVRKTRQAEWSER